MAFEVATRDLVGLALRSVEDLEMSLPQFRVLLLLHERGRSSSGQCAEALGVAASSVTRLADRLHASGHLVRGADPSHRSIVTLELTDVGRRVVRGVTARRRKELGAALDRLSPRERASCATALTRLHGLLGDVDEGQYTQLPL